MYNQTRRAAPLASVGGLVVLALGGTAMVGCANHGSDGNVAGPPAASGAQTAAIAASWKKLDADDHLWRPGQYQKIIPDYLAALRVEPTNQVIRLKLATLYFASGQRAKQVATLREIAAGKDVVAAKAARGWLRKLQSGAPGG